MRTPYVLDAISKKSAALTRRNWLQATAAGVWLASTGKVLGQESAELVKGKDGRLEVLSKEPIVLQTPVELLDRKGVTPSELLFVRNNQLLAGADTMQPLKLAGWKVELGGLMETAAGEAAFTFDAEKLTEMEAESVEMVLQCSGNSRALFAQAVKTKGTQWGRGGVGLVKFTGVKLSKVLEKFGVKIKPQAKFLLAQGRDDAAAGMADFEHSLPLDDVLEKSLLVWEMNGGPLPAIHGGPVRLVTLGYYGTVHMKWLSRLQFDAEESNNYHHIPRYRTPVKPIAPGEPIEYTFANSVPNWRMNVKSVILHPAPDAKVPVGPLEVRGVAFNDGAAKLEAVYISIDQGRSWHQAELERAESPYAWTRFQTKVKLPAGSHSVWSRAIDALGRSQPIDGTVHWNPSGYEWNGVEKISVQVG